MNKTLKYIFIGVGIFIVIGIILESTGDQPKKVGETSKPETTQPEIEQPKTETFSIGEQIKLGDYVLTVNSVEHCVSKNEFSQPESGNKFIVADISQENVGSASRDYNLWYFTLQDNKDYSYQTAFSACKEPSFDSGTLQPEMKTRGYITFEIPEGNQAIKLIFTPDWLGTEQIIIEL